MRKWLARLVVVLVWAALAITAVWLLVAWLTWFGSNP